MSEEFEPGAPSKADRIKQLQEDINKAKERLHVELATEQSMRQAEIDESASKYPESQQECTCSGEHASEKIRCRKHLSRAFQNTGCYWCNYTDCSRRGC